MYREPARKPPIVLFGRLEFMEACVRERTRTHGTSRSCEGKDGLRYHKPICRPPGSLAGVHDPTINKQLLSRIRESRYQSDDHPGYKALQ
jgi:hypothetical protein